MSPRRIQRRRTKGWRMPEGALYVGRPTQWGNLWHFETPLIIDPVTHLPNDRASAVRRFRPYAEDRLRLSPDWLAPLRGHDLACWCPLDHPCHADVLLELANA